MRKVADLLFFVVAFSALMWGIQKARAEDKPLAVCKEGQCVMSEADYKRLQEFVALTQQRADYNDKVETEINRRLEELGGGAREMQSG